MQTLCLASAHTYCNDFVEEIVEENCNWEDTSKWQLIEQLCKLLKLKCIVYISYKQPEIRYAFSYVLALLRKTMVAHWWSHEFWLWQALKEYRLFSGSSFAILSLALSSWGSVTICRMDTRMKELFFSWTFPNEERLLIWSIYKCGTVITLVIIFILWVFLCCSCISSSSTEHPKMTE